MTTGAGCVRKFEKVVKLQCTEAMNNIVAYNKVTEEASVFSDCIFNLVRRSL